MIDGVIHYHFSLHVLKSHICHVESAPKSFTRFLTRNLFFDNGMRLYDIYNCIAKLQLQLQFSEYKKEYSFLEPTY